MDEKKICFIFVVLYLLVACIFSGCKSARVSTDENILYYQRKIDELEATVRLYEQRITIADEQIRNDIDSLKYLGQNINAELNNCYETITRYETKLKGLIKIVTILLSVIVIRLLGMVAGYILYAKGIKLPRWLDILL